MISMITVMKVIGIVLLVIVVLTVTAVCVFWHKNIHWYDPYKKALDKAGAIERQAALPSGNVIHYGEVPNDKPALLLIHGQMGSWKDYALVMPALSRHWHIYAVDVYGHGRSTHDESLYYIDTNGDDLIWFIDHVIGAATVVSGHSNGALTAAYIAAHGGDHISGVLLEDPPVFSTQGEGWEESFAYLDTYKPLHDYVLSDRSECWEAYYLRHCYWGQLFMKRAMDPIADYAERYHKAHPGEAVKIGFLPSSIWSVFEYAKDYDPAYGEHFYDLSWNHGIAHEKILSDISVPCVYIHAKETLHDSATLLCAASREQAERAVSYIGGNCRLIETPTSDHMIHTVHRQLYIEIVNSLL